jgi:thiamine kinase-like enzyme
VDAVRELAHDLEGGRVVITAAHNDLTMANVLTSREGIGILDWEAAVADGLPMTDLWYALGRGVPRRPHDAP